MPTIDHPSYYCEDTGHEAIAVIEAWGLGFRLGNCVKYISRAGLKGSRLDDLRKARWYLDREIQAIEAELDEEEAKAEEAESKPRFTAKPKRGKVGIVDEDGDARWIVSPGEAWMIACALRRAVEDGGSSMPAGNDRPTAWRSEADGRIYLEYGSLALQGLTDREAAALCLDIGVVLERMP